VVLAGLVSAACGARLTPAQRTAALSQGGGSGSGGATGGDTSGGATGGTAATGSTSSATGGTTTGAAGSTAAGTTTGGGSTGTTTGTGSGPAGAATSGGVAPGTTDFTKAPAGGNGGATDVGVTATSITVANVSDVSGAVPGLFEDARFATQAYFKYFAARYGTLYGRKINVLALDSQLDSGANRSASIQACSDAFAGVGSVSAFDQGGAPVIKGCGIPDLRGLSTTDQMKAVPNAFPINSAGFGGKRSMAVYGWAAEKFPNAVKQAAYVYSDGDVTRQLEQQDVEGAEHMLGFKFIDQIPVGTAETNYGPAVNELKSKGAKYVTFVGAYQQAANLAKEFVNQGYKPDVYQPTVTAYSPNYIKQAGAASEGTYIAIAPSLLEEINGNQELQLYAQWLRQVRPNAVPTAIGQFAWASAALFVEKMIKVGPKPTRKALLAEIPGIHAYTGNGLFPAQDVGGRELSDCTSVVQVKGGKFVRIEPAAPRTFRCKDGVWNTKTKKPEKGFPK
jgi:hypothetical protein